jgi:carbon monoxide dehydrogenase subunit G
LGQPCAPAVDYVRDYQSGLPKRVLNRDVWSTSSAISKVKKPRRGTWHRNMHFAAVALALVSVGFSPATRSTPAASHAACSASCARSSPRMVLGLPMPPTPWGAWPGTGMGPERLRDGGTWIDYQMESLHLTKRRVSGGIVVEAPAQDIWDVLTAYEQLPEVVPNILSNVVTRHANGAVTIEQSSLISRRLNLVTEMTLDVQADEDKRSLVLTRTSGHGFLEFVGSYTLKAQGNGATYLQYMVEMVPCPIFPMPIVETKIRKEVPKMLLAVRDAARKRSSSREQ